MSRDVKLTLRAKDEASVVVAKVVAALEKYGIGADKLGKSLSPLGSKFTRVTEEVSRLQSTIAKSKGQITLNTQYAALTKTLSDLSAEHAKLSGEVASLNSDLAKSKSRVDQARNSREALRQTLHEEREALKAVNREVASNTSGISRANEVIRKNSRELDERNAKLAKYRTDLAGAQAAQRNATAEDERATRTLEVLRARLADLGAAREAQRKALAGRGGMSARTDRMNALAGRTGDPWAGVAARSFAEDEGAARSRMLGTDSEISRITGLIAAAERTKQKTSSVLNSVRNDIRAIQSDMVRTDITASLTRKINAATADLATYTRGLDSANARSAALEISTANLTADIERQDAVITAASADVRTYEGQIRKLTSEMGRADAGIKGATSAISEMSAVAQAGGFGKMGTDVAALEKAVARLQHRLNEMADIYGRLARYADGAGGFAQAGDAAKLRNLNAQLNTAAEDAAKFRAEIERLKSGLSGAGRNSQQTKDEIKNLSAAIVVAERDARQFKQEIREIGIAAGTMRGTLADAWRKHNIESRTALSLQQRIRGQVLSLISAYVGLYGVANGIREVTGAFMQQEGALSRLGVVFDGNQTRMRVELDWIRRDAQRLGIEFGVLADEYTKFAVAGNTAGFADESIRKIFTAVSESARVNKLGLEDVKGVYLALGQIVSKGKFSAEEVRQQLGERLPGALKLLADALGVTTAELDDMMKKGDAIASEENMLRFADVLNKAFGSQLPQALQTFSAELGRLQNTIYKSKVLVGKGGLMDALQESMKRVNEFANSKEGVKFFLALGNAMGKMAEWIPYIVENFESLAKVFKLIIAVPIISFFSRNAAVVLKFGRYVWDALAAMLGAPGAIRSFSASMMSATTATGAATVAVNGLKAALLTLGPIAAGIVAAGFVFSTLSDWGNGVDAIVEAQAQHSRIMDEVLSKYDEAKNKTYTWQQAISDKNREELVAQVLPNQEAAQKAAFNVLSTDLGMMFSLGNNSPDELQARFGVPAAQTEAIIQDWKNFGKNINKVTKADIDKLRASLIEYSKVMPDDAIRDRLNAAIKKLDIFDTASGNVALLTRVLRDLGYSVTDAENILGRFPITVQEAADGVSGAKDELAGFKDEVAAAFITPLEEALKEAGAFGDNIEGLDLTKTITDPFTGGKKSIGEMRTSLAILKGYLPQISEAFKAFSNDASLSKLENSLAWMRNIPMLAGILDKFMSGKIAEGLSGKVEDYGKFAEYANSGKGWMIRAFESYRDKAYADQKEMGGFSAWRVGYGSDTITDPVTGKSRKTQQGDTITRAEGEADLARRIANYIEAITAKIGTERWESFSDNQQEVLLSLAHNYGAIPDRILNVVKTGTAKDIADAIRAEVRPGSVNNTRRQEEAAVFEKGGAFSSDPYFKAAEERQKAEKKAQEDAEKRKKGIDDENRSLEQGLAIEQLRVDGKEREAFIQEKINSYVDKHGKMSDAELAKLREQYGKLYDLQNLKSKDEQTQEKIKKHQEEINRLETERNALMDQREFAMSRGETDKVAEIDKQLVGVNAQLDAAITRFIEFWKASGSPEAAAGIATLDALKMKLAETGKTAVLTAQQINENIAGGAADSFEALARAWGQGENAFDSMRDAFLSFASDFLIEIGKMIVKQTILNALQNAGGEGSGGIGGMILGGLKAITTGVFHSGKGAGQRSSNMRRAVDPSIFNGAPKFHTGKLPALGPTEMPAIIESSEEVLPENHPRHIKNQKGSKAQMLSATINNFLDIDALRQAVLAHPEADAAIMNVIGANPSKVRKVISK